MKVQALALCMLISGLIGTTVIVLQAIRIKAPTPYASPTQRVSQAAAVIISILLLVAGLALACCYGVGL